MKQFIVLFFTFLMRVLSTAQTSTIPSQIVMNGAKPEKAGGGYVFTEGSSVRSDGAVFFTDQPNDRIYMWEAGKGIVLFKEGTDRANGTCFDDKDNLIACADLHNSLVKFTPHGEKIVVYDGGYEGKYFNGPNDLWIDPQGGIYFTDPYYSRNYWAKGHEQLLSIQGVYYLNPSGKLIRVVDDLIQPNGIVGTPDGAFLYVADIRAGITFKYKINPDGTLSGKTQFAPAGSDGMTIDKKGNVYLTSGKVLIFNSNGEKAGEIEVPESPSNLCFGGKNRNILFITARTSVYTIKMKTRGAE